jgi:hypothetical protein
MPLKNNWQNGDLFTPAAANDMADAVNSATDDVANAVSAAADAATEAVEELVTDALAEEATVIASAASAAATAATAEIAARNLVAADDLRIPRLGDDDRLVVRDRAGKIAVEVTDNGQTVIGNVTLENDRYSNGLRILDAEDKVAFEVRTDGTVYVGEFAEDSDGGSTRPLTVHVLIAAGQSNMAGAAFPTDAEIDPPNPRIFQFGASARTITTATVPLDMVDADTSNGISPITFIARSWLQRIGPDDVVLIIPGARGGTQLNSATATNASGVWNAAYTGASTDMYGLLKSQITEALAAIPLRWPGSTIKIVGLFWHQGEANLGTTFSDYNGWFDAIVSDLRTHVSDSDMPVVLGGLVPEYSPGDLTPRSSHVDTPSRVVRTGFAEGVSNGSGYNDLTHYTRQGSAELANRMVAAYDRALVNTADSGPLPPLTVQATLVAGVLTINWAQPLCRYTGFTVEYSTNAGSTWTSITKTDVSATATASGVTGPVLVRVATINNVGTSATSTPVYATSGA